MAPVSKMDEGTVGSLLAQDSRWYHTKIENQIKQNQALLLHLQQEVARLEIDRSNRCGGIMVCRKLFCTFIYNYVYHKVGCIIIPNLEFQDCFIMDPCSLAVLFCNVMVFDVLVLAIYITYIAKKIPKIKEKLQRKWMGFDSENEEDSQTSVSNASTMKKEIMTVDNVIFEAE